MCSLDYVAHTCSLLKHVFLSLMDMGRWSNLYHADIGSKLPLGTLRNPTDAVDYRHRSCDPELACHRGSSKVSHSVFSCAVVRHVCWHVCQFHRPNVAYWGPVPVWTESIWEGLSLPGVNAPPWSRYRADVNTRCWDLRFSRTDQRHLVHIIASIDLYLYKTLQIRLFSSQCQ